MLIDTERGTNGGTRVSLLAGRFLQEIIWNLGLVIYRRWFRLRVDGLGNLPVRGPYLIVSNHASHLDGPAALAAHGLHYRNVFSLGAQDYFFRSRFRAWVSRYALNMLPIDRNRVDLRALARCRAIAAEGRSILMFPEGTRSVDGVMRPFKPGFGLFAQKLGLPIVPAYIHGTFASLPKGSLVPRRRTITVAFGRPIDVESCGAAASRSRRRAYLRLAADAFHAIERLRESVEADGKQARAREWPKSALVQSS